MREEDFTQEALATELAAPELFSAPSQKLPTFRHTFTHYHLNITPVLIRLPESAPLLVTDDAHRMWFHTRDNRPIGLSAPAVKLLATLSKERSV